MNKINCVKIRNGKNCRIIFYVFKIPVIKYPDFSICKDKAFKEAETKPSSRTCPSYFFVVIDYHADYFGIILSHKNFGNTWKIFALFQKFFYAAHCFVRFFLSFRELHYKTLPYSTPIHQQCRLFLFCILPYFYLNIILKVTHLIKIV